MKITNIYSLAFSLHPPIPQAVNLYHQQTSNLWNKWGPHQKTISYCVYIKTFHLNLKSYIYYLTYHSNKVTYYQCDLFFIFNISIVNLQCYVNFWFIASDPILHIYIYVSVCIYILFHIFFHYSLLKDIQYSSLSDLLHLVKSSSMIIFRSIHVAASLVAQMVQHLLQCRRPRFNTWVGEISWRRKWQPAPIFLPGKSHGWRSLVV